MSVPATDKTNSEHYLQVYRNSKSYGVYSC